MSSTAALEALVFAGLAVFTAFVIRIYASPKARSHVLVVAFIGWYITFSVIVLLPIDVANARLGQPNSRAYHVLHTLWESSYWSLIMLGYVALPLQCDYILSGGFTVRRRCIDALRENIRLMLIMLVALLACCIYLAVKNGFRYIISDFPPLLIQLNHAVVLTVVVVFQGLGLADVPKRLWYSADHVLVLKQLRFSAVSAHDTMTDRKSKLRECVAVLVELRDETSRWSDEQDSGDVIARVTQLCLEVRPQSLLEEVSATTPRSPSTRFSNVFGGDHRRFLRMTKHERIEHLIKLRRKLGDAITEAHRAEWQWNALKEEAFTREDIMRQTKGYTNAEGCCGKLCNKLRWWWLRWLKSLALRLSAVVCMLLSLMVIFGVATVPWKDKVNLSLSAYFVDNSTSPFAIQLAVFVPLTYSCTCMINAIFKIKFFSLFSMHADRSTDDFSLLLVGRCFCTLTAPTCYNFLMEMDTKVYNRTAYSTLLSSMSQVPGGEAFNRFLPMAMIVIFLLNLSSYLGQVAGMCGFTSLQHVDSLDVDDISEGTALLRKARHAEGRAGTSKFEREHASSKQSLLRDAAGSLGDNTSGKLERSTSEANNQRTYTSRRGTKPLDDLLASAGDIRPTPPSMWERLMRRKESPRGAIQGDTASFFR